MRTSLKILVFIGVLLIFGLVVWAVWGDISPVLKDFFSPHTQAEFEEIFKGYGFAGGLVAFLMQMIQVLSVVFPAAPVQLAVGTTYGVALGLPICVAAIFAANLTAYGIARHFGGRLMPRLFSGNAIKKYAFLQKSKNLNAALFLIYIIPGVPNGMIPYIAVAAGIPFKRFILVITLASIPAVFSMTFTGQCLISGRYTELIIFAIVIALVSVLGFIFRKRLLGLASKTTED